MLPQAQTFQQGRFHYTQVRREGAWAIFMQVHQPTGRTRWEVVRIRAMDDHTWPNGTTTPAHECYPASGAWGTDGFTCFTLAGAETLLAEKGP